MKEHQPPDAGLGERLRASIEAGHLPAIDLAQVQRRADRRARRRTTATAVAAGAGALALAGALAVTVPAINTVTGGRAVSSADGSLADQGVTGPSGSLADPSLWADLPPVSSNSAPYLSPAAVASVVGSGTWYEPAATMAAPWTSRECSPNPLRDDPEADVGPRPAGTHVEPWAARRSDPAGDPAGEQAAPLPYEAFASLAVLRWEPTDDDAAQQWQQAIADEAASCPGATRVEPGATIASLPVAVVARPSDADPQTESNRSWTAVAVTSGGPTAVQVRYAGAPTAKAAGDAALALLREGVAAVAARDQAGRALDAGARSGGVGDARLADFTDPQRWDTAPNLQTVTTPRVDQVTPEDLQAAFPETSSWQSQPVAGTGMDWLHSWCTPRAFVEADIPDRPGDPLAGGVPGSESFGIWQGRSKAGGDPRADVDVLRWHPRDASGEPTGPAGVDDLARSAADTWGAAIAADAASCPGATALDPAGLPGSHATLTAVDAGGTWRVQAVSVGGPTAVRIEATIDADDAATAGDQAVALARRVIVNIARADDVALGRPDPGPLP